MNATLRPALDRTALPEETETTDVIVVGSGAAGLAAAIGAASRGVDVLLLEKSTTVGGTTHKSGGVFWMPGNRLQSERGFTEPRGAALEYMARVSAPDRYDVHAVRRGLDPWEDDLLSAYVEHGPGVLGHLEELGALEPVLAGDGQFPDYHCDLPEQRSVRGRALAPLCADGSAGTGSDLVDRLTAAAERGGISILTGVAFEDLLLDDDRVVGVVTRSAQGRMALLARGGVVLATGGFSHDDVRRGLLPGRVWGSCAAPGSTGDALPGLEAIGVPLTNMDCAWWDQVAIEHTLDGDTETRAGVWVAPGDASLIVDLSGRRVVNEKAVYNTRAQVHLGAGAPEVLLLVLDGRSLELFSHQEFAYPIGPADTSDPRHLMVGATWADLTSAIDGRLLELRSHVGGARLDRGFEPRLLATVASFNAFAHAGLDPEFRRGEQPIELFFNGPARPGSGPNPTMAPFADSGPYYAVLVGLGTLDTKGGPRTDPEGRVLDDGLSPVPGLYAAGNCAASPSGHGYWAAGATIGPALVFGFRAGQHAARRSIDTHLTSPSGSSHSPLVPEHDPRLEVQA